MSTAGGRDSALSYSSFGGMGCCKAGVLNYLQSEILASSSPICIGAVSICLRVDLVRFIVKTGNDLRFSYGALYRGLGCCGVETGFQWSISWEISVLSISV